MNIPTIDTEVTTITDVKDAIKGFALLFKKEPVVSLKYDWGYWVDFTWKDGYKDKNFIIVKDHFSTKIISIGNKSIKAEIYDSRLKRTRTVLLQPINEDTYPDSHYFSHITLQS